MFRQALFYVNIRLFMYNILSVQTHNIRNIFGQLIVSNSNHSNYCIADSKKHRQNDDESIYFAILYKNQCVFACIFFIND